MSFYYYLSPVMVLLVTVVAMLLQRFIHDRGGRLRHFDGVSDLMAHIHAPGSADSALRWLSRGFMSFCFYLVGLGVGIEGAAIEVSQAVAIKTRGRANQHSEQRRRSDAAAALTAGIGAAFGAPFAAVILAMELGLGGPILPAVLAALVGFFGVKVLTGGQGTLSLPVISVAQGFFENMTPAGLQIVALGLVALLGGVVSALFLFLNRVLERHLRAVFQSRSSLWMRNLTAGMVLFFLAIIFSAGHLHPATFLENLLWGRYPLTTALQSFFCLFLGLLLLTRGFGTTGVFAPLFVLGGALGTLVQTAFFQGGSDFAVLATLVGGAALWGGVLGVPLAAGVLVMEMSGNWVGGGLALVSALVARLVAQFLRVEPLVEMELKARNIALIDGRSSEVLSGILVRDAMVTDFETVLETEPIGELYGRMLRARYPFLPVVNSKGNYLGLLSVDLVVDAWRDYEKIIEGGSQQLSRLVEAKDLLYRIRKKWPTVRAKDNLTATQGVFSYTPCIGVCEDDDRVVGLLFSYNVRLVYDREMARRALVDRGRRRA